MDFEAELKNRVRYADDVIITYLPKEYGLQKTVIDAMKYTISAGGKRIRPVLMKAVYQLFGGSDSIIEPFMAAIEMIHTYSLIHDDLPALDNDDYRRGRKTAHIVYGEAMAILAGDGLLNYAYETASKAFSMIRKCDENASVADMKAEIIIRRRIEHSMEILASRPGIYGMIGGQTADVELTGKRLNKEQLIYIYENKTGALIDAAMTIGAVLAGASESDIDKICKTAYNIGMAFQIKDDILDEISTFEELGKPIHSDEESGKVTYVTLYGMEASKKEVERLSEEAVSYVRDFQGDTDFITELIKYLINRTK